MMGRCGTWVWLGSLAGVEGFVVLPTTCLITFL